MVVDEGFEIVQGVADGVWRGGLLEGKGEPGPQDARMSSTVKQRDTKAVVGEVVTMCAEDTPYEASQSESAQVIGHHAECELAGVEAQEWSEALPYLPGAALAYERRWLFSWAHPTKTTPSSSLKRLRCSRAISSLR